MRTRPTRPIAWLAGPALVPAALIPAVLGLAPGPAAAQESPGRSTGGREIGPFTLHDARSGTGALLQAVSAVDAETVWVSGHEGAVLRSLDGGETWVPRPVQTLDSLQFRDVHAFDARRAVILSSGEGAASRIYRTEDGGASWRLAWRNEEPEGFYDCLDFWDDRRGVLYGDAVGGELRILTTADGGATWQRVPAGDLPAPAGSEGGFAASGTCVAAGSDGGAWIATGAGDRPRLLYSTDHGATWGARDLPLPSGAAAGGFSVVRADGLGFVLGGDLQRAEERTENVVRTTDAGRTWSRAAPPPFPGAVYGGAFGAGLGGALFAVGPGGLAASTDMADSWVPLDARSFWAVGAAGDRAWAVGPDGRIVVIRRP